MDGLRQYIISITAAAILCGILTGFFGKKGTISAVVKLLSGLFLALTVIRPWIQLEINDLSDFLDSISVSSSDAVQAGKTSAEDALRERIKAKTEAYILDKATAWDAELTVEITLSEADPPVPCAVCLSGRVSPYAKVQLSKMLEEDLGIAKEDQTWTG